MDSGKNGREGDNGNNNDDDDDNDNEQETTASYCRLGPRQAAGSAMRLIKSKYLVA